MKRPSFLVIILCAAAAVLLALELSGVLFLALTGLRESVATPLTFIDALLLCRPCGKSMRWVLTLSGGIPAAGLVGLTILAIRGPERPLHGDAKFASAGDVQKAGLLSDKPDPCSILVGKAFGHYLAYGGPRFALLAAPTRSGKGVSAVIPNCLSWPESIVVLDIKEENFDLSSGFRSKVLGQPVFLFAPFDENGISHCWNPLSYVSASPIDRVADLDMIAGSLYAAKDERDSFWAENAKDLFRGLALLVLETPGIPHTIGQILREASGCGESLKKHIERRFREASDCARPYSSACRDSLNRVLQNSENTLSSIVATFNVPLLAWQNPRVDAATSENTPGLDLREIRRSPFTVYLGVTPDRLEDARVIVNLFFNQIINLNTRTLPSQDPTLSHPVLLILDEFTSVGRVPMIARSVSYIAGYGIRLLTIIQNRSQLEDTYGKSGSVTILANHALQIIFAPSPVVTQDAKEASEMLGYSTVKKRSRTRGSGPRSGSVSTSDERRALLLPQEIQALGPDQEIVALEGCRPILAEKIRYYSDPVFQSRLLPSLREMIPRIDVEQFEAVLIRRTRDITPSELEHPTPEIVKATAAHAVTRLAPDPPRKFRNIRALHDYVGDLGVAIASGTGMMSEKAARNAIPLKSDTPDSVGSPVTASSKLAKRFSA